MKMRRFTLILVSVFLLGVLLITSAAFGPCVEKRKVEDRLAGFRVTAFASSGLTGGDGTLANPYQYPEGLVSLDYAAQAIDLHGKPVAFDGEVSIKVIPGEMSGSSTATFAGGQASGTVQVFRTFGRLALWMEDVRWVNGPLAQNPITNFKYQLMKPEGSFTTGVSNLIHIGNPSIRTFQYDEALVQYGDIDGSALAGNFIEIDCRKTIKPEWSAPHGQVVVTGIFSDGFYVTDLADQGKGFNHLYVYSFSFPENLEIGDWIDSLAGTAQDFSGNSQVSFPMWTRAENENKDPLPFRVPMDQIDVLLPPTQITSAMCAEGGGSNPHLCGYSKQNWALEALEASRVKLNDLKFPDAHIDCDYNGNTTIEFSPSAEASCRDNCLLRDGTAEIFSKEIIARPETLKAMAQADSSTCTNDSACGAGGKCGQDGICRVICPWESAIANIQPFCYKVKVPQDVVCSELTTLRQFGQWTAAMDQGSGPLINLVTRETLPDFNPTDQTSLGVNLRDQEALQGNLVQVRAARPRWLVMVGFLPNDAPAWMKP